MSKDPRNKIRNPHCEECVLHEEAEHVCLMGDGPIPCNIMVVGEAPGHREDEAHRAFVGKAGQLLNKLLEEAGLPRRDCYITNVARCRPPDNRTPTKPEIKVCVSEYFWDELEVVQPNYVLLLGNSALYGVTKRSGIKKHRGSTHALHNGSTALATYHPAAILRNPYLGADLSADIQRFGRMVRGEATEIHTKTVVVNSKQRLVALRRLLERSGVISFDIETYAGEHSALEHWHEDSVIISIGFTVKEGQGFVVPLWHNKSKWRDPQKVLDYLKPTLEDPSKKYIAHNGKFDTRYLAEFGIYVPYTFDTMYAAHMLDENRVKGLKSLSQTLLGADAYDVGEDLKDAPEMPLKQLCVYNAKDCDYTMRLYHRFKGELSDEARTARVFTKLIMPAARMLTRVEYGGIQLDLERLDTRTQQAYDVTNKIRRFMLPYLPPDKKPDAFDTDRTSDLINFNSPQQVADWFFNDLDLPILERTKTKAPSTKESVLLQLAKQHPAPKALLKYRKWAKYISTYLHPWKYNHDDHGRIHPGYKLDGTVTGRLSSSDPNLQNVPRNPFIRSIIGVPEGWSFVEADFMQIELRLIAMVANDPNLLRVFHQGGDPHLDMAVEISGKLPEDITKEERKHAKPVNFGFAFGMGAPRFVDYARDEYDVDFTEEEAYEVREAFFKKWPALQQWHERQRRLVRRYHRVHSPLGRIRHLPDVQSEDKKVRAEAERQAINSPIQSCASDLMLLSALRLDSSLENRRARLVGLVHDSGLFEIRDDYLDEALPTIRETMESAIIEDVKKKFGADITVPIRAEISVGKHWSQGEEWDEG